MSWNFQLFCKAITPYLCVSQRLAALSWRQWSLVREWSASTIQTPFSNMWVVYYAVRPLLKKATSLFCVCFLITWDESYFCYCAQAYLGVYMFAGGETSLAQKCFLRARLLALTIHGEDHPYVATIDVGASAFPSKKIKGIFAKQ